MNLVTHVGKTVLPFTLHYLIPKEHLIDPLLLPSKMVPCGDQYTLLGTFKFEGSRPYTKWSIKA